MLLAWDSLSEGLDDLSRTQAAMTDRRIDKISEHTGVLRILSVPSLAWDSSRAEHLGWHNPSK